MITKAETTRTVEERITVYKCLTCGVEFENNDYGELSAKEHAKTHAPLIYLHPGHKYVDTVWIEEGALIKGGGPYKPLHMINHANRGRSAVDWDGPGWYVWHEYEVHYQNDTRQYREFRHVDKAYNELRDKLREQSQDLRTYRALQKKGKP